ncbi:Paired domain-containing protein [Aphelenchoides besseyi]|nr:Paired domain-containing protein [Aphelenchoides besseyi]KAI6211906.1 Paired domain-containing protein [Aphelenchoides besseyi]
MLLTSISENEQSESIKALRQTCDPLLMDCAYVSSQHRVYVHAHRAEDLVARFPTSVALATPLAATISSSANLGLVGSTLLACQSTATVNYAIESPHSAPSSSIDQQSGAQTLKAENAESPSTISNFSPTTLNVVSCGCLIDISTPATLQRDFYAWLQGDFCSSSASSASSTSPRNPPTCYASCIAEDELTAPFFFSTQPSTSAIPVVVESNPFVANESKTRQRRRRNGAGTSRAASGRGTNLYGRPYCPGRPLSMDERYQIIQLFHAGMKVNAISKQLCISHGCVSKIITRFRETGLLIPSSHAECRRRKRMQMEAENRIKAELQQY